MYASMANVRTIEIDIAIRFGVTLAKWHKAYMEAKVEKIPASVPSTVLSVFFHLCLPHLEPMMDEKESPMVKTRRGPAMMSIGRDFVAEP